MTEIAKEKREQEKEDKIQNLKISVKQFEKNNSKRDLLFFSKSMQCILIFFSKHSFASTYQKLISTLYDKVGFLLQISVYNLFLNPFIL